MHVLGSEAWEEYSSGFLGLIKDFVLSVWEERKVRLYGEHANVHQSHSQNDSGDLRGVAGGDGELGCLCGKVGTSHAVRCFRQHGRTDLEWQCEHHTQCLRRLREMEHSE